MAKESYKNNIKPYRKIAIEEIRNCKFCGKEFIWSSSMPHKKFCSKECCFEQMSKKFKEMSRGVIVKGDGKRYNYYRLRFEIFKRDNFTCQYCGRNVKGDKIKLHCDHINPKKKGGLFVADNLITSCEECNEGEKDVLLENKRL